MRKKARVGKGKAGAFVKGYGALSMKDVASVGGKNASLGEMYRNLRKRGVRIPGGFAVTAAAYWRHIDHSGLRKAIKSTMKGLDTKDLRGLAERGKAIRKAIEEAPMPEIRDIK